MHGATMKIAVACFVDHKIYSELHTENRPLNTAII